MIDDDDGDESPSPEPRTDSRSALMGKIRAWRWLHIVKRDDFFSLIFLSESKHIELELASEGFQGAHEVGGRALGGRARPPPSWTGCGSPGLHLLQGFFIFSE